MPGAVATAYVKLIPTFDKKLKSTISSELGKVDGKSAGSKVGKLFSKGVESGSSSLSGKMTQKFSAMTVAAGNLMSNAVTSVASRAASGLSEIMSEAFNGFSDFQQLSGGVEKIFDEADIAGIMLDANNAFYELNMSANEYLASINQVGAAFAATMGDQKGYDTARTGMKAIADFASGTGLSIEHLNEKYAMISRSTSSYQSICDQFSGILPQTNKDFLEQAQAAGFLSDSYKSLTDVPVAEYQEALSKMLEKGVKDMGLAENTAHESFETVSGSLAMLKGAWTNLLSSLGRDDADFGQLATDLNTSLAAVFDNVIPLLGNIAANIVENVPMLFSELGGAIQKSLLPQLQGAFSGLFGEIDLSKMAPGLESMASAAESFLAPIGEFVSGSGLAFDGMMERINGHIEDLGPALDAFAGAFDTLATNLKPVGEVLGPLVAEILGNIGSAIVGLAPIAVNVGTAIMNVISDVLFVVGTIAGFFSDAATGAQEAFDGLVSWVSGIPGAIERFFTDLPANIGKFFDDAYKNACKAFDDIVAYVTDIPGRIVDFFSGLGGRISDAIGNISFPTPHLGAPTTVDVAGETIELPNVNWYAKGAVFDRATLLAGVGEAGPEAVVPLRGRYMEPFAKAIGEQMGGPRQQVVNNYTINGLSYMPDSAIASGVRMIFAEAERESMMIGKAV